MVKRQTIGWSIIAALVVFLHVSPTRAIMMTPEQFDASVPENWRAPFSQFLTEFGVADAEPTVAASKTTSYQKASDGHGPEMMIFRVIHPDACTPGQDECITIIAHLDNEMLLADAIFYAGGRINHGDMFPRVLGVRSFPIFFHSKKMIVGVLSTAKGLLVSSSPAEQTK